MDDVSDIKALLEGAEVEEQEEAAPAPEEKEAEAPAAEAEAPAEDAGEEEPAPEQEIDEVAELKKKLALLEAQLQLKQVEAPKEEEPKKEEPKKASLAEAISAADVNVPDQLVELITSGDPAAVKQGISYLMKGIAVSMGQLLEERLQAVQSELASSTQQTLQLTQEQQRIAQDFYSAYPQLSAPEYAPVVQSAAYAVVNEMMAAGQTPQWNKALRDAIAQRAMAQLGLARKKKAPPKQVKPAARPATPEPGKVDEVTLIKETFGDL